ncbi:hypothetical protein [Salinimicrobium sp. TH3]|uniref:hypothetical protein n=1 Tax=Salinimicrobium sp. TH3 TaxID=2997342 RepID=UPI002274A871|nr:hypothetical protein [Salinimicrobium sp. TH3]MCY2687618.1 hypothetical protein [Salinimicrobium sp. TH3]
MENSIETIWTKGFLKEEALLAPRVNNLYNKKSSLLIEKLKRTYRTDNKSILPLAILAVIGFGIAGHLLTGFYIMVLMTGMFFLNRKKLASLERISIETSSYEYLLEYREMFLKLKRFYTRLLGFGLPVAGIAGYFLFFWNTPLLHDFLQLDIIYILGILLGLSLLLSAIGVMAYRLSLKLVYGRFIQKLDEMLTDMEELRK